MSARTSHEDLLKRCEAVGWQIRTVGNGASRFLVTTHDGGTFTFGRSGDWRGMRNALKQAERLGLLDLEARLAAKHDRDRVRKIQADRARVLVTTSSVSTMQPPSLSLPSSSSKSSTHDEEKESDNVKETVEKKVSASAGDLGHVDGVAIAEIAPAMIETPVSHGPQRLRNGEELLLTDGRVVYRCTLQTAGKMCGKTFGSSRSLSSHVAAHSRPDRKTGSLNTDQPRALPTVRRRRTRPTTGDTTGGKTPSQAADKIVAKLRTIGHNLVVIGTNLDRLGRDIILTSEEINDLVADAHVDPEIIEKARRFDALAKHLLG